MAKKIDWYYNRKGCKTCAKTNGYLEENGYTVSREKNASAKLGRKDAEDLAKKAAKICIAKGKKVMCYDMKKDKPDSETLLSGMLGPTGNLRAPALVRGETLLIGFNEDMYKESL